jgi:hypothetical protein
MAFLFVCFVFFDSLRESHSLDNAPSVPKTDQSLSSLFRELASSGFGGMPELQSICKNPSPQVNARGERSSSTSIPNRWRVNLNPAVD